MTITKEEELKAKYMASIDKVLQKRKAEQQNIITDINALFDPIILSVAEKVNCRPIDVARGYFVVGVDLGGGKYIEVVQRIDGLIGEEKVPQFRSDQEAGIQAMKDGLKLFTSNHPEIRGWYIVDNPQNRAIVNQLENGNF